MILDEIYDKAFNLNPLDEEEGTALYYEAPIEELMFVADRLRQIHVPGRNVGWIIDRNVNITNLSVGCIIHLFNVSLHPLVII